MAKRPEAGAELEAAMAAALAAVEQREKSAEPDGQGTVEVEVNTEPPNGDAKPSVTEGELRDQLLRLAADFDNFRKRSARQLEETRKFGIDRLLLDLLPVLDNLERALAHAGDASDPIVQGVRMVAKGFLDTLAQHGVQAFDSVGQVFDPERHEAVGQAPSGTAAPGTILEEMQKGYMLHERLLRAAQVIVAAGTAPDGHGGADERGGASDSDGGREDGR